VSQRHDPLVTALHGSPVAALIAMARNVSLAWCLAIHHSSAREWTELSIVETVPQCSTWRTSTVVVSPTRKRLLLLDIVARASQAAKGTSRVNESDRSRIGVVGFGNEHEEGARAVGQTLPWAEYLTPLVGLATQLEFTGIRRTRQAIDGREPPLEPAGTVRTSYGSL